MSEERIDQFRQMVSADPQNELGHFSLGRAYLEAGLNKQAIASLQRAIELNPKLGRAYELLAQAMLQTGMKPQAIDVLTRGVPVADERGERLSRDAMIQTLKTLGSPVPELPSAKHPAQPIAENEVLCGRCGNLGAKLVRPPFRNDQGMLIQTHVCAPCWKEWLEMGTKVINELRLPLNEPEAQRVYERHMLEFLNLSDQAGK
jgi:Fe-S cluster biosynthesis and repair protein YggX